MLTAPSLDPVATGLSRDAAPFAFLKQGQAQGLRGALVSISGIDGGAPKPLGAHMAVLEDGRWIGHVSGGCVEAAIAAEVVPVIAGRTDEIIRFGKGSCFIDIRFPCGGGVDLLVHTRPEGTLLDAALDRFARRQAFSIAFDPATSTSRIVEPTLATCWIDGMFQRRYLPRTKLIAVGRGPDLEVIARVAAAAELDLAFATPDEGTAASLAALGAPITQLRTPGQAIDLPIDRWTAIVLLFHEHEWENAILARAAAADGFYVGALGSVRTHRERCERLRGMGVPEEHIARIKGPIGMIDRAREPGMLALSVLAEITAARAALDRG
jgi:xanthine dehydrogenase accessory factor